MTFLMRKARVATSAPIAEAITNLRRLLEDQYGTDYSFTVLARGQVIGADDAAHHIVEPVVVSGGVLPRGRK